MKTLIVFRIAAALLILLPVSNAFGQASTRTGALSTVYIYSNSAVNNEVRRAFTKEFQDAVNPKWAVMDQDYFVRFMSKDQKNHVLYNKKGAIIYHITYGNEQTMPQDILAQVKTQYPACEIITAINVKQDQRNIWVINLKYQGDLVLARCEDGRLDEVDRTHDASI